MPPNHVKNTTKLLSSTPAQPLSGNSEGGGGILENRLPRFSRLIKALIADGRLYDDAWKTIDRELEFELAHSAERRLRPLAPQNRPRDKRGNFIHGFTKNG